MLVRLLGCIVVPTWLTAMGWLVVHDVVPAWTAQDAPHLVVTDWLRDEGQQSQWGIYNKSGRIGTVWTTYAIDAQSIARRDIIWVDRLLEGIGEFKLDIDSTFRADGVLDEFTLEVLNPRRQVAKLHGERFHSDFSFELDVNRGEVKKTFKVPLTHAGMISGGFNPITHLSDVEIGQRWRIQVVNPLALLTGMGKQFMTVMVEVTDQQVLQTPGGNVWCTVITSPSVKAWVSEHGVVERQEIILPVGGMVWTIREPFDADRYQNILFGRE